MSTNRKPNEFIDISFYFQLLRQNWWLFALIITISLGIAYAVNKYSPRLYNVKTSVVISEESNSFNNASARLMEDIGFFSSDKNFANELLILKSSPLIKSAIGKLNLRISYFKNETFGAKELYKSAPFIVILNPEHPQPINCKISIDIINQDNYRIYISHDDAQIFSFVSNQVTQILPVFEINGMAKFNETVTNEHFSFKILLNNNLNLNEIKQGEYWFVINSDKKIIRSFQGALDIKPPDLESTVATIQMNTKIPELAIDFLNNLTEAYLNKDIVEKQHISEKTIEYINSQLNKVSESLDVAEDDLQRFRSSKQVLDISMQAEQIYNELNDLKNEKAKFTVNLKYVDYIQDYFKKNTQYTDLITPAAMGIDDPTLNSLIEELIRLNAEKASFIENNQEKSPYLQKINIRIDNLRSMISENIVYIRRTTNIALEDADSRIRQLNNEIRKMPETERELLGIERVFNINNNIYTYLLEKRSEAEIAKASYQPSIEIVEPADVSGQLVSPQKKKNYAIGFLLGFFVPFGFLQVRHLVRKNFTDTNEIESNISLPLLGKIYHNSKNTESIIDDFPESHIAESFRMVRFNLNYFLNGSSTNKITITSTISGEGKSFIALNLANIISSNNYRTVLVGCDIRKPKKYDILIPQNIKLGISEYLSNQANFEDIIQKTHKENLDIVYAGSIPPNPAELLASERMDEFLKYLNDFYDYIVIDTPPIGVVTDGLTLMEKSDLNILVTRLKYTPKKEFESTISDLQTKKLINAIVINDIPIDRKKKYGYGYYIT